MTPMMRTQRRLFSGGSQNLPPRAVLRTAAKQRWRMDYCQNAGYNRRVRSLFPREGPIRVRRAILAFNGDLESRLALHWLVHERDCEVTTLLINLGQEVYLEPLGELALELGATAAQVLDRREKFLYEYAMPVLEADAVYQASCFLGSALARYVIAN